MLFCPTRIFHKLWRAVIHCDVLVLPSVEISGDILPFFLLLHYFITLNELKQTNLQDPHLRREKNY